MPVPNAHVNMSTVSQVIPRLLASFSLGLATIEGASLAQGCYGTPVDAAAEAAAEAGTPAAIVDSSEKEIPGKLWGARRRRTSAPKCVECTPAPFVLRAVAWGLLIPSTRPPLKRRTVSRVCIRWFSRTCTRPTLNRPTESNPTTAWALTLKVTHAPISVECLFPMTLHGGVAVPEGARGLRGSGAQRQVRRPSGEGHL